jgi:hypothetical protein
MARLAVMSTAGIAFLTFRVLRIVLIASLEWVAGTGDAAASTTQTVTNRHLCLWVIGRLLPVQLSD